MSPIHKKITYFFVTIQVFCVQAYSEVLDLKSVYEASIKNTQTVSIQESRQSQTEEQVSQAKGGLYPSLALHASYVYQDTANATSDTGIASAFRRPDQYTTRIALTHPLFRGFRELAGIRMANAQLDSQEALTEQSKISLYASVAQAYYNVLAAEADIANLKTLSDLTQKRIQELSNRSRIGRSRTGEVLSAQSQLAIIRSQLEAAYAQLDQSRNQFQMATALPKDTTLASAPNPRSDLKTLDFYLEKLTTRPDLRALQRQVDAAEESISIARGAHLPTIDFLGNYYLKRTGVLENTKWDVGATLTFPIFQGGIIQSQVRQASQRAKEQELILAQARREAETQLRSSYRLVNAGLDQIRALTEATQIAERNYKEQTRDYSYGLVSNLEVLQALNAFQETKRSLDRTRYQTLSSWALLEATSNTIPSSILPQKGATE